MDHLPSPKNPVFIREPPVPYVCTESYDGLNFLTYPTRAGWPQVLPSPTYPDFGKYEQKHPSDDRKLEKFFQTWIFFGLLHEVLSPQALYDERDYIRTVAGVKFVHTKKLMDRLGQWCGIVRQWHPSMKIPVYLHLVECLQLAEKALQVLCEPDKTALFKADLKHPDFDRPIKTSLAAICEAIVNVADETLMPVGQTRMPNGWSRIWWDSKREHGLRQVGWCPNEITMLTADLAIFSVQYYMRLTKKVGWRERRNAHLDCTANSCQERQVKKGTYRTAHCCEGGNCGLVGPHRGDIYFRLSIGTFPLLGISGHNVNEVRLTTVSHEPGVRYMAVSHVWSDGLGNETSNRLPSCQLLRLRSFASRLRRVHIPWGREAIDDSPLYLWIDTLCCPVADSSQEQKHYKQVAIGAMRQVYEKAAYVLVVDNTLLPFAYKEIGVLEAGLRLFTSPWMQRLWTLQEAVLAKNLVIQFKDRAVDLRTIWQDARSIRESDLSLRAISLWIEAQCARVRTFFHMDADNTGGGDMVKVATSMKLRRLSKPGDEALCIASIMKLNVSDIAGMDNDVEGRMCALWTAMAGVDRGIYKDIVFSTLRRLRTEGFRWAPASLQQSVFTMGEIPSDDTNASAQRATLISRGLLVKLPGFNFRTAYPHPQLPSTLWPGNELARDVVHLRHPDGRWFYITRNYPHKYPEKETPDRPIPGRDLTDPGKTLWDILADQGKSRYLLLEDARHSSTFQRFGQQMGLIASPEECEGGAIVMRSLVTVTVADTETNDTALFDYAYDLAGIVRKQNFEPPFLKERVFYFVMQMLTEALQDQGNAAILQNAALTETGSSSIHAGILNATASMRAEGMDQIADLLSSVTLSESEPLWTAQNLLGALVAARVMGRYAVVQESFEPDKVWCID